MTGAPPKANTSGMALASANSAGDFRLYTTTVIPQLTQVRIYEETIDKVKKGHPEILILKSVEDAVKNAIEAPTHVYQSYANSLVYADTLTTDASGNPLLVPIKIIDGTSGRVKTFYFGSTSSSANLIWSKTNG